MKPMWFVYVLLCVDGSFYTGITTDVEMRFQSHVSGKGAKYTRSHPPIKILHQESFPSKSAAAQRECQIKSWTKQEKIQKLDL